MFIDVAAFMETVREELMESVRCEAWRGREWLKKSPQHVIKTFMSRMHPRYQHNPFSLHLKKTLTHYGYRSLKSLVLEMIDRYFMLQRAGLIEARLVKRGGFRR